MKPKNQIAYAHMKFTRRDLLRFIIRGGLFVQIKIDYDKQTLTWEWKLPPKEANT